MRCRTLLLLGLVASFGCGRTLTKDARLDASTDDAGTTPRDASPLDDAGDLGAPDLGPAEIGPVEVGPVDLGPADTGPVADTTLGREGVCLLGAEARVTAALRYVACEADDEDRVSAVAVLEALDSGLVGSIMADPNTWLGFDAGQGCDYWRCMALATSCEAAAACGSARPICSPNQLGLSRCRGGAIQVCGRDRRFSTRVDCTAFDATCVNGECVRGDCRFGPNSEATRNAECSADRSRVVVCEGELELDCEAFVSGSSCDSFYIQGEFPMRWCSTEGTVPGSYPRASDCGPRGLLLTPVTRAEAIRVDCRALGYSGCTGRGCQR